MIVSIHIPRTAGTTLGILLDFATQRRVLFDYYPDYGFASELDPDVKNNLQFIRSRFSAIHGHFLYRKYAHVFADASVISCIRHPVERLVSQFRLELIKGLSGGSGWQAELIASGKMDFVDFAQSDPLLRRAQTAHLEGRRLKDYDFILLHERFEIDLVGCFNKFGLNRSDPWEPALPRITSSAKLDERPELQTKFSEYGQVTEEQKSRVFLLIPEEVELYREAQALKKCDATREAVTYFSANIRQ